MQAQESLTAGHSCKYVEFWRLTFSCLGLKSTAGTWQNKTRFLFVCVCSNEIKVVVSSTCKTRFAARSVSYGIFELKDRKVHRTNTGFRKKNYQNCRKKYISTCISKKKFKKIDGYFSGTLKLKSSTLIKKNPLKTKTVVSLPIISKNRRYNTQMENVFITLTYFFY